MTATPQDQFDAAHDAYQDVFDGGNHAAALRAALEAAAERAGAVAWMFDYCHKRMVWLDKPAESELFRNVTPLYKHPPIGEADEVNREAVDKAVRRARKFYFQHNPANTLLANEFNEILRANGTFESDTEKHYAREAAAMQGAKP